MSEQIKEWSNEDPHVPLQIDEDGMVTRIGHDMGGSYEYKEKASEVFETCIICGKLTDVLINTHIDFRHGYVEGAGQCCRECYNRKSDDGGDEYIQRVMKYRTTLLTITAEDVINTPNNSELGALIRKRLWEVIEERKKYDYEGKIYESPDGGKTIYERNIGEKERTLIKDRKGKWVCKICGEDTSEVEYDYLFGTNHIQCELERNK